MINKQYRLTPEEAALIKDRRAKGVENILIIGDLHEPFCREGYLEHCIDTYHKYNCNKVVFIGDVIDNHYSSFHEEDPDGYSAGEELDRAIDRVSKWYEAFNNDTVPGGVEVCIGNHDAIITRKLFSSGISKRWVRKYSDVLGTNDWIWGDSFMHNGVLYVHGTGSSGKGAIKRVLEWQCSVVQGHIHTEAYVNWYCNKEYKLFSMQVGAGVDDRSYAMAYAKHFTKKYIISCGVVLDNGTMPMVIPMDLG
jgi:predicted phosphodiesterase